MSASSESAASTGRRGEGYFRIAERPLQSLLFILPILAAYEAGTRWLASTDGPAAAAPAHVVAFTLMQRFFVMVGATDAMLPALAVVVVLLAWHIARKDPWTLRPWVACGMAVESTLLALPLLAIGFAAANHLPLWRVDAETTNLILLSLGAGVYEEAVFRLGALTLLSMVFCDVLGVPQRTGVALALVASSVLFASYHYWGSEAFAWRSMVFRSVAGGYFGILFLSRGFGVTVGAHAAYDIIIVALRHFATGAA